MPATSIPKPSSSICWTVGRLLAAQSGRIGLILAAPRAELHQAHASDKFILTKLVAPKGVESARLEVVWGLNQAPWPYLVGADEAADAFRQPVFAPRRATA